MLAQLEKPLVSCSCRAQCLFAIPRSLNSKLLTPVGDGDNFEKAIYDLLQRRNWLLDDRLIVSGSWDKRFLPAGAKGYTKVTIHSIDFKDLEI